MGLDQNSEGEWVVVRDRVPQAMVDAMRALRIKSERKSERRIVGRSESRTMAASGRTSEVRIKTEPTGDVGDIYGDDVDMADLILSDDQVLDMTDSTAVFEEIRVYLDVERDLPGGHVYVDEDGTKVETVMRSVEVKTHSTVDVKMGDDDDLSDDRNHAGNLNRESLASIAEDIAEDGEWLAIDLTAGGEQEGVGILEGTTSGTNEGRNGPIRRYIMLELFWTPATNHVAFPNSSGKDIQISHQSQ